MSLGFEQAGFDVVAAVEIDPIHCAVHEFNFPRCVMFPRSVADLTGDEIRSKSKIGRRKVDVVFGGPPCQGFSLIGHRALDDPRNQLVREFVRLVSELQPSYFVFENVKGLTVGNHAAFLQELIATFEDCGYRIRLPWAVLDAAFFEVPQHRERLILIGARRGMRLPEYPLPICFPADHPKERGLKKGPTCREALADLPDAEQFEELRFADNARPRKWGRLSKYAEQLRCKDRQSWHYGYEREWDPTLLTSSLRTEHTAISRRRFASTPHGEVEPISRFYKLRPDGLCNTLRAGTDSARGAFTSPRPIHYDHPRCITVREMARLHGFPDWFRFHQTKWHGARQIGNAVPPPLGRAVASQIIQALGIPAEHPKTRIPLGNPVLLSMDMSAASAYFDVPVPIGKRDRKSGQRKRKQHEIESEFEMALPFKPEIALTL